MFNGKWNGIVKEASGCLYGFECFHNSGFFAFRFVFDCSSFLLVVIVMNVENKIQKKNVENVFWDSQKRSG